MKSSSTPAIIYLDNALESGDFDALADMDKAFEKLSEVDDMGPDM